MKDILKKLIQFKTHEDNPYKHSEVYDLYKYVINQIPEPYKYKIYHHEGEDSLIVYKNQPKYSKVVLQAHIDVVPGEDYLFKPIEKNGRIYGRGASDMKFAVAAYIELLKEFKDSPVDLGMWLTSDEESGGKNGTGYLLNKLGFKTDIVILPDGNNGNCLVTKTKGLQHFKWSTIGKPGHGAEPWEGVNAIDRLITAYNELRGNALFTKHDSPKWRNTINIGSIKGGLATNMIPEHAEAKIDVRFTTNNYIPRILQLIDKLTIKYKMTFVDIDNAKAFELDIKNKYVSKFFDTLKESGIKFKLDVDNGSSDASFFAENNIQAIIYKPICGGDHSNEEWIDMESLSEFNELILNYIKSIK
jgi:succinyl-diaminopimelate desuccinylase